CFPRLACTLRGSVFMQVHGQAQAAEGQGCEGSDGTGKRMQNRQSTKYVASEPDRPGDNSEKAHNFGCGLFCFYPRTPSKIWRRSVRSNQWGMESVVKNMPA
ncbi:hypothetical protein QMN21_16845, partial [Serratia sp. Se-PFBMAAmG]|nr:hypothetical protein [Serratia sp. Se-PFBMAAmG]